MIRKLSQRKFLLVLPILIIPSMTFAFWALGGGRDTKEAAQTNNALNLQLPEAAIKEENFTDKLAFYDKATRDSVKRSEWLRADPAFKNDTLPSMSFSDDQLHPSVYGQVSINNEQQLLQRLGQLQQQINQPKTYKPAPTPTTDFTSEVDRLEQLMQVISEKGQEDPEMKRLEGTLDKIIAIQHPEQINKEQAIANNFHIVTTQQDTTATGFYTLNQFRKKDSANAIKAIVHETQTLTSGSIIKLRLLEDVYISGQKIPANNFVYGIAALNNERLQIEIPNIRAQANIYPVQLEVYDLDGLAGIHIPGAITRDVAKQSADNSLQLVDMTSMDPSFKAQATTAGINTAKNLLSKKVKQIKVTVKAGYQLLLLNKKN